MDFIIETVVSDRDETATMEIRERVFGHELGIRPAPVEGRASHLLARAAPGGEAVGTLSVVDTSGDWGSTKAPASASARRRAPRATFTSPC